MDICQFIAGSFPPGPVQKAQSETETVTYHDPCHLKKSLGLAAEPRSLISAAPGFELVEMADADRCCGMGGSFNLQHYELSAKIGEVKRQSILQTKADTVATCCPACMMQITDLLSKAGADIRVKHVIEIYAQGIRADAGSARNPGQA
jgi:glycolate oxidase iron-sulfur subunit